MMPGMTTDLCHDRQDACRKEVYAALNNRVHWKYMAIIVVLIFGCYALVWGSDRATQGSVIQLQLGGKERETVMKELKEAVKELKEEIRRFRSAQLGEAPRADRDTQDEAQKRP